MRAPEPPALRTAGARAVNTAEPAVKSITVSVSQQTLRAALADGETMQFAIATASNGVGQNYGSECTPLGKHRIRARIGAGQPLNAVFVGRRPTGEIYSERLRAAHPGRDWILTRILWLCGNEVGFNRLHRVDTMRRFIYIHGAPDSDAMGVPSSHGCIKMRNTEVIELFDRCTVGTPVHIEQ